MSPNGCHDKRGGSGSARGFKGDLKWWMFLFGGFWERMEGGCLEPLQRQGRHRGDKVKSLAVMSCGDLADLGSCGNGRLIEYVNVMGCSFGTEWGDCS